MIDTIYVVARMPSEGMVSFAKEEDAHEYLAGMPVPERSRWSATPVSLHPPGDPPPGIYRFALIYYTQEGRVEISPALRLSGVGESGITTRSTLLYSRPAHILEFPVEADGYANAYARCVTIKQQLIGSGFALISTTLMEFDPEKGFFTEETPE